MKLITITSKRAPYVSITIDSSTSEHIKQHFESNTPGSKFYVDNPNHLLQMVVDSFPDAIRNAVSNENNCKIVSVAFPYEIGTCNVVAFDKLTDEERSSLRFIQRGDKIVKCFSSKRVFPTKECQLILDENNNVITVYPGELAPPLPDAPDIHDRYWDNHAFLVFK